MSNTIHIKEARLRSLMTESANYALERAGLLSRFTTRAAAVREIGRSKFEKAVKDGHLSIIKGEGNNSTVLILREEFERFLESSLTRSK